MWYVYDLKSSGAVLLDNNRLNNQVSLKNKICENLIGSILV